MPDANPVFQDRDGARVGWFIQRDHIPGKAGSVAFEVDDLEGLRIQAFHQCFTTF